MRKVLVRICMFFIMAVLLSGVEVKADCVTGYYPSITLNVPKMSQYPKGCGIASMGQGEGYFFDQTDRAYSSSPVYSLIRTYNTSATYASWGSVGYLKKGATSEAAYLQALYQQLANGYPVIVFRRSNDGGTHFSTVYAYTGSATKLTTSGFQVVNTNQSLSYVKKESLSSWLKNATAIDIYDSDYPNQYKYIVRRSGIPNPSSLVSGITFAINHPPYQHKQGTTQPALGTISSKSNLTSVTAGVYDLSGNKKFAASATPNAKYYNINNLDSKMTFASLAAGNYDYIVTAKDASGVTKTYKYRFKVVSSAVTSTSITFTYNVNGGTGTMATQTVNYGGNLVIPSADHLYREGYRFAGFAAYRSSDKTYYTNGGYGWQTQANITANGYTKKAYIPGTSYAINSSWILNPYIDNNFILAAMWEKDDTFVLPFVDVSENDWFYDVVKYVYQNNIMTGMDASHFGPYEPLSRAQFALILYRMSGEPAVNISSVFHDISGDEWYGKAVLWAYDNGIVSGYINGNFGPADMITREQIAVMMHRYAAYLGTSSSAHGDISTFKDGNSVSSFAAGAMKWAVGNGIITGKNNGTTLDPQGNTARAEAAAIIQRFMKK